MNSDINLLVKKEDIDFKEKKRVKLLRIISAVFLGITAVAIVGLFAFYSQLKMVSIKKNQDSVIQSMSSLHEKSAKLIAVKDRAAIITDVFKKRKDFQQAINEITKQFSSDIKISEINISSEGISIRLSSASLYDTKVFIDKMVALAQGKRVIKDLTIESFAYDTKNNKYNLVINSNLL